MKTTDWSVDIDRRFWPWMLAAVLVAGCASSPPIVEPVSWAQQAELIASDGAPKEQFGFSVAVSGDTAIVGAVGKASLQGAAYAFVGL